MITKGIVESIEGYKARVRLPIYNGISNTKDSTSSNDLSLAVICSLPNINNPVSVGDIVFVAFEDNDNSKPIILGHLFKETVSDTSVDLNLRLLNVKSTTKLSKETTIGDVKPVEIQMLTGLKSNIQAQFNEITDQIDQTSTEVANKINQTSIEINSQINQMSQELSEKTEDLTILIEEVAKSSSKIFKVIDNSQNIDLTISTKNYYEFTNNNITGITLTLEPPEEDGVVSQYLFEFTINSTVPNIVYKNIDGSIASVIYANGWDASDFEVGYKYILCIFNNIVYVSYVEV